MKKFVFHSSVLYSVNSSQFLLVHKAENWVNVLIPKPQQESVVLKRMRNKELFLKKKMTELLKTLYAGKYYILVY